MPLYVSLSANPTIIRTMNITMPITIAIDGLMIYSFTFLDENVSEKTFFVSCAKFSFVCFC